MLEPGRPRLSLCIATVERAALLAEMLSTLEAQWGPGLELVIVDGGSRDETPEVVARFRDRLAPLTYIKLAERGGFDQDYHRAVAAAHGDYAWLLSDDDSLEPDAIAVVLATLASDPSLVVVNSTLYDATLTHPLGPGQLRLSADALYPATDYTRLFVDTANQLSFVGAVVIDRALWLRRMPERYFGSLFGHVGVIFQSPLPAHAVALARPLIRVRAANASWSQRYFEVWMFLWPQLIWSFEGLPDTAKQAVFAREPWRRPGALAICRAKASYDQATYARWIAPRLPSGPNRWVAAFIARLPGPLVNALAVSYFRLFRPNARADLLDFTLSPYHWSRLGAGRAKRDR